MIDCLFCRIVSHNEPAAIVLDDQRFLAFLDDRPLFPGHCLLIPKTHRATLAELPPEDAAPLVSYAQLLCSALEDALGAEGAFVAINHRVSQSVPHLHVHVVPRRRRDGLRGFFWPRQKYRDSAELENVRSKLADAVTRLKSHCKLPPFVS